MIESKAATGPVGEPAPSSHFRIVSAALPGERPQSVAMSTRDSRWRSRRLALRVVV